MKLMPNENASIEEERESAIILAHYILDRANADPDDDYAILARQFLREGERRQAEHDATLERAAKELKWYPALAQKIRALKRSK